jgi:hypothetical protein
MGPSVKIQMGKNSFSMLQRVGIYAVRVWDRVSTMTADKV